MDKNAKIGVVGFGVEGMALVDYLLKHGYRNIAIFDENSEAEKHLHDIKGHDGSTAIRTFFGANIFEHMTDREIVFRSPGIHPDKLKKVAAAGITITSSTQYFLKHCPCPVIGVTGTKGKGTTSTLIFLMLKEAGEDVYLGGNIGESPLTFLDQLKPSSKVVLEMSSFQLQDVTISPHIAVVLNITSDHLDYHRDAAEYHLAKTPIVRFQKLHDVMIANEDYDDARFFGDLSSAKKITVSTQHPVARGAFVEKEKVWLRLDTEFSRGDGPKETLEIIDVRDIKLFGAHHLENILPAVYVAALNGVSPQEMKKVLTTFQGLPHRLQLVADIDGVRYFDDSIATTPETSLAATHAFQSPVILIAGGSEKNADYSEWAVGLLRNPHVKAVILMGQTSKKMAAALEKAAQNSATGRDLKVFQAKDLEEAVTFARQQAGSGSAVLLSPAAASFDMFRNYKERGDQFKAIVTRSISRS